MNDGSIGLLHHLKQNYCRTVEDSCQPDGGKHQCQLIQKRERTVLVQIEHI